MHTMHPTVLAGPADWDAAALPREEFDQRIAALWRGCDRTLAGVLVHGSPRHHAELAWLTNVTPKLEPVLALIPAAGAPQLLIGGGVNMVPAAKPLTWIGDAAALRGAGKAVLGWTEQLPIGPLGLVGFDDMRVELHQEIVGVLDGVLTMNDVTANLRFEMRRKSARELALITQACAMLDAAVVPMRAAKATGKGATDVVLAAEQAAYERGAQDVRTLFSPDGGRTLWPFDAPVATAVDPLQVYVAVRHRGYWAESFVMLADSPAPALDKAREALQQALPLITPGTKRSDIDDAIARALAPENIHPVVTRAAASIGLSLEDEGAAGDTLLDGEVVSLRAGALGATGGAICSAMVLVERDAHQMLWEQH
jgi:peptidase M24-like protein